MRRKHGEEVCQNEDCSNIITGDSVGESMALYNMVLCDDCIEVLSPSRGRKRANKKKDASTDTSIIEDLNFDSVDAVKDAIKDLATVALKHANEGEVNKVDAIRKVCQILVDYYMPILYETIDEEVGEAIKLAKKAQYDAELLIRDLNEARAETAKIKAELQVVTADRDRLKFTIMSREKNK